jgi:hypothetical protein
MAEREYFAHYSPDGVSPWHWFDKAGYDYLHAGENLAVHFTESDAVVDAWMDSPTHRANIMNGLYTEIGVGTARGEYKGYPTLFVVQLFGTARKPVASIPKEETSTIARAAEENLQNQTPATPVVLSAQSDKDLLPDETATVHEDDVHGADDTVKDTEVIISEPFVSTSSTEIQDLDETQNPVVVGVYSDMATTSRDGEPAPPPVVAQVSDNPPSLFGLVTSPHVWLQALYGVLALFVVVSLLTSLAVEWRRHHRMQSVYALGLLMIMGALLYVHISLTSSGVMIV